MKLVHPCVSAIPFGYLGWHCHTARRIKPFLPHTPNNIQTKRILLLIQKNRKAVFNRT